MDEKSKGISISRSGVSVQHFPKESGKDKTTGHKPVVLLAKGHFDSVW